jgi:hypothetical protein
MKTSFSPRVRGSMGTMTAPRIEHAIIVSTNSGWLRSIAATRSPRETPRARRPAARRLALAARSA